MGSELAYVVMPSTVKSVSRVEVARIHTDELTIRKFPLLSEDGKLCKATQGR